MLLNTDSDFGEYFVFIPVLQPLFSNRYYVIHADGKYKGLASKCSTEDDVSYCCSRRIIQDVEPRPFDHRDELQQFEICSDGDAGFHAKSVVPSSFPPAFLRVKFFLFEENKRVYQFHDDAKGLDNSIRSRLPKFDSSTTNMVVGKWYTPFVFVKEGSLNVQMKKSLFYTVMLERLWEKIYSLENDGRESKVALNVEMRREVDFLFGVEVLRRNNGDNGGFIWFKSGGGKLGLSLAVWEGMRWLEESIGWVNGVERVERVMEIGDGAAGSGWRRFDCYVLVKKFALGMDGTLVLNCDFRHTHEIRTIWE
ncbi:Detected protein of unknown function [Hibiscus syriacus]|uniref:Uncharacterized protein n=1 Tax=Hibiscus syriacus TaxID=106335 RepID=A0A6A2XGK4_HIBSY|nr:uncharacterized protein LOC120177377 [Hibiscus syriacus]KAE8668870.1 Detected protein of unknown function [Hibiscus syriacus]